MDDWIVENIRDQDAFLIFLGFLLLESMLVLGLFELLRRLLDDFTLSFDKNFFDLLCFDSLGLLFYLFLEMMAVFTTFYLFLSYFFIYLGLLRDFGLDLLEPLLFLLF